MCQTRDRKRRYQLVSTMQNEAKREYDVSGRECERRGRNDTRRWQFSSFFQNRVDPRSMFAAGRRGTRVSPASCARVSPAGVSVGVPRWAIEPASRPALAPADHFTLLQHRQPIHGPRDVVRTPGMAPMSQTPSQRTGAGARIGVYTDDIRSVWRQKSRAPQPERRHSGVATATVVV